MPDDRPGVWVEDPDTAADLINDLNWPTDDASMKLLRELSYVVDGERERVRFVVGDPP